MKVFYGIPRSLRKTYGYFGPAISTRDQYAGYFFTLEDWANSQHRDRWAPLPDETPLETMLRTSKAAVPTWKDKLTYKWYQFTHRGQLKAFEAHETVFNEAKSLSNTQINNVRILLGDLPGPNMFSAEPAELKSSKRVRAVTQAHDATVVRTENHPLPKTGALDPSSSMLGGDLGEVLSDITGVKPPLPVSEETYNAVKESIEHDHTN